MYTSITKQYRPIVTNDFIVSSYEEMRIKFILVINDKNKANLRQKSLEFHIKSNDYFGTLATIIDFVRNEKKIIEETQNKILENLKDDLLYLHDNYKIIKK